ncbi:MAG: OmpH family outer membrane protein [Sphingomonas sp.]
MTRFSLAASAAALAFIPAAAQAQNLTPAVIAVVDTDRIVQSCTVCAAANTQLQAQVTQLQQRAQALGAPLQTEEQAIRTALAAIPQGQQPDAALQARVRAFQTSQQNAQTELSQGQERIQRNAAFVRQQIGQRVQPAIVTVMQQRGATIAVDRGATLAINPAVDVTDAVLAIVNQNTAALNINAPAPAAPAAGTPQQPAPQQPRPRPQGR